MKSLIGSVKLLGMQNFIGFILLFPFNLAKLSISDLSKKLTMTYSNVPGPYKNYDFNGSKCNSMVAFLPAVGEMLCGLSFLSLGEISKFGLITDTHYIQEPDEFMQILHDKTNLFINGGIGTNALKS